jgi:segregation and condensation protein B
MLERDWIRVVGHRDVPGKPEMFGTTKQFLDYFGLQSIDQLPALAEIREHGPETFPQTDFIEGLAEQDAPVAHAENAEIGAPSEIEDDAAGQPGPADAALSESSNSV